MKNSQELIDIIKVRFEKNKHRHQDLQWSDIEALIINNKKIMTTLQNMEDTGGEPDVIHLNDGIYFVDCAQESPKERRSLCYDKAAWESRKTHKPQDNALDHADKLGIKLLSEEDYMHLQSLGDFDLKTSSWLQTPEDIRSKGGAIFGDKRFGRTFIYHNGAESYYSARAYRGKLKIQ